MEMRAKEDIDTAQDLTPPLPPLAFCLYDSSLSSHCSSCFIPLSTTCITTTATTSLRYCSNCLSTTTSLHFSSAEHHLFSLLHSHPSLFPHSSSADLRLALRLLHRLSPLSLSPRFHGLLTNRDALISNQLNFSRVTVGARVMAMAQAMRDEREFDSNGEFQFEEAVLCLVITNAVEINLNGERLGIGVYDWRFSWINHSCSPNSCFRFVPSFVDSQMSVYSSSLKIFASGDAVNVDSRCHCGSCELAEGVDNSGPRVIVRSTKEIQRGEEVTITYTDLLQPTAVRQSELLLEYTFICNCRRCNAVPQVYVDHALQETFCVDHYNSCSNNWDNHDKENASEKLTDMLDNILAEYMEVGDPTSCCEKVEELLSNGLFHQHTGVKLSPLHYLSLKAYTILMSTYKVRTDLSIGENHLQSIDTCRSSAAYSLMLACATHHLFLSEPALIASAATFWVDAGKSLLYLGRNPSWKTLMDGELQNTSALLDVSCPKCSLMKFESSFSSTLRKNEVFNGVVQEFHKCLSSITRKIWSFMIQSCKYLKDVRDPIDFGWVRAMRTSKNVMSERDEFLLCNVGVSGNESIDVRSDIFRLGIHCVLFGGYLWSICDGQSCGTHLIHNLLHI